MRTLFFDTETTSFATNTRLVELAWLIADDGYTVSEQCHKIKPNGFIIDNSDFHGITHEHASHGNPLWQVSKWFLDALYQVQRIVAHNFSFDSNVLKKENLDLNFFDSLSHFCTMKDSRIINFCGYKNSYGKPKWPSLQELHYTLFRDVFDNPHNALSDVQATKRCYYELKSRGIIT